MTGTIDLVQEFCTACGRTFDDPDCPVSHDTALASADVGIGTIVTYRRALKARTAVVVGKEAETFLVIEESGNTASVRTKAAKPADPAAMQTIPSPLFRLRTLALNKPWKEILPSWISENQDDLLATIGDRRVFALAATSAGDLDLARSSGLPLSEVNWLAMHVMRHAQDMKSVFRIALTLEPDTYPDHVLILIEAVSAHADLLDDPSLLIDHLRSMPHNMPGRALIAGITELLQVEDEDTAALEFAGISGTDTRSDIHHILTQDGPVPANPWSRAITMDSISVADLEAVADRPNPPELAHPNDRGLLAPEADAREPVVV